MDNNFFNIQLGLHGSWCNNWPEISIDINDQNYWHGFVETDQQINLKFMPDINNVVRISYLNKRNGPDIWDTQIDNDTIINDQYCILTTLKIQQSKCDWLIPSLQYTYLDNSSKFTHGFMDQKGYFSIKFPMDLYPWVATQRQSYLNPVSRNSSLSYENLYIPDSDNQGIKNLVNDIKKIIETFDD